MNKSKRTTNIICGILWLYLTLIIHIEFLTSDNDRSVMVDLVIALGLTVVMSGAMLLLYAVLRVIFDAIYNE